MAKMETLRDDFGSGALVTAKWDNSTPGVAVASSRCEIVEGYSQFTILATTTLFDLNGSYFSAKVDPGSLFAADTRILDISVANFPAVYPGFRLVSDGTLDLEFRWVVDGSETITNIPYDPTNHAWFRIRESGGTVYWETSPNGVSWVVRRSVSHSSTTALGAVKPSIGVQSFATGNVIYVDNVNVAPNPGAFLPFFI